MAASLSQPDILGVGGTCYTEHTLNQFKRLGLDHRCAIKLARKFHAHSVMYAKNLVTTRRAIGNKTFLTVSFVVEERIMMALGRLSCVWGGVQDEKSIVKS
eukprot:1155251-Pelagomonas_calceolata.AAC.1